MNQELKDRIFAAADDLYTENGEFPNVEAVRQRARAGMNYVVEALKEWRQKQRMLVQNVREPLPAELHDAMTAFGNHIWEVAQRLANDALESARAAFEAEKSDLARLSAEQSDAYEALAAEHDRTVEEFTRLQGRAAQLEEERSTLVEQLRTAQQEAHVAATETREKAALVDRLEKDLERARADVDGVRAELTASRRELADEREKASKAEAKHGAEKEVVQREIDALRRHDNELAQELAGSQRAATKAEAERDKLAEQLADVRKRTADEIHRALEKVQQRETETAQARNEARAAGEQLARTLGELDAAKAQVVDLRAIIKDLSPMKLAPKA
ncbi:MAG: KfrA protein [uncultured Paraburkholderia sp.]|nr:MAG: KfrA protein [uncultured Paraburkholderia sp.]CAH2939634.1 MAG: KfrA protein [uncultured Paraburkholderia sp.]